MFKVDDKVIVIGNTENTHMFPIGTVCTVIAPLAIPFPGTVLVKEHGRLQATQEILIQDLKKI